MPELMNTIMADGPSSNPSQPVKPLLRAWGTWVEGIITAFLSNGGLIYDTKAHMDADLLHGANSSAWVLGDATVANNGIYLKLGASGAGSWTRIADLPYSYIAATDAGVGTPNAIVATTSIPIPSADAGALISMPVFEANTGSPVTVVFNGGTVLTVKTAAGNNVVAGGLVAGMVIAGYKSGSTFRLLSDQASSAIQAAAEAAAASAAASAAAAAAAVPNAFPATRTALKAINTSVITSAYLTEAGREGQFIWRSGDYSAQIAADTTEGIYVKAATIAATSGAWVRAFNGAASVLWFGTLNDGAGSGNVTANNAALAGAKAWMAAAFAAGAHASLVFPAGIYDFTVFPNFAITNAIVTPIGEARLRYWGTGTAITLGPSGIASSVWNFHFGRFHVDCPSTALDAVLVQSVHHSVIDLNIHGAGAANAALRTLWCVCTEFPGYTCSVNEGWYLSSKPGYGAVIDAPASSSISATSYCLFTNPVIEGTNDGVLNVTANGNIWIGGTIEGITNTAITDGALSRNNVYNGIDLEANGLFDIYCSGYGNDYINLKAFKDVLFDTATCIGNRVSGGEYQKLRTSATAVRNIFSNLVTNMGGSGGITDLAAQTVIINVLDKTAGSFVASKMQSALSVQGPILSSAVLGIGYATGAGGTVTQATSKATGVTLSKASGAITMNAAALAAGTIVSFVLTNTSIAATDVLVLNHISGGTVGSYALNAQCAAGSATINVRNNTAGSLTEAIVIQFALIKGVNA